MDVHTASTRIQLSFRDCLLNDTELANNPVERTASQPTGRVGGGGVRGGWLAFAHFYRCAGEMK